MKKNQEIRILCVLPIDNFHYEPSELLLVKLNAVL